MQICRKGREGAESLGPGTLFLFLFPVGLLLFFRGLLINQLCVTVLAVHGVVRAGGD